MSGMNSLHQFQFQLCIFQLMYRESAVQINRDIKCFIVFYFLMNILTI